MAAKDEQSKGKEKTSGRSGKKRLIIIGSISVVVIAIAVSVFLFMRGRGEEGEDSAEAGVEKKQETGDAKKLPAIYPLEPFIVNISDGQNLRYLKIKLEFEISNAETKAEIDPLQAPLRDAILVLLSGKHMEEITSTEGKNKLRNEVMAIVGKTVPPGKISRVYFTDFVVQ